MRAAKVQLEQIGACVFRATNDVMPSRTLRFDHQRGNHRVLRKALLHLADLAEIDFDRTIADQLDVVEPDHPLILIINRTVSRGGIDDWFADGLPDGATPSCVESAHHLISRIS